MAINCNHKNNNNSNSKKGDRTQIEIIRWMMITIMIEIMITIMHSVLNRNRIMVIANGQARKVIYNNPEKKGISKNRSTICLRSSKKANQEED